MNGVEQNEMELNGAEWNHPIHFLQIQTTEPIYLSLHYIPLHYIPLNPNKA
jgi:hypothetical protein